MKVQFAIIALLTITWLPYVIPQKSSNYDAAENSQARRDRRQTSADQMVQNILNWLEGVHSQGNRKIRQDGLRTYLPPQQSPRPFQPAPAEEYGPPRQEPQYPEIFPAVPGPESENEITSRPVESSPLPQPTSSNEPVGPPELPHEPETPSNPDSNAPEPEPEPEQPTSGEPGYSSYEPTPQPPFPPLNPSVPSEPEITGYPPAGEKPEPPFQLPGETPSPIEPVPVPTEIPSVPDQPENPDDSQPSEPIEPTGYPPASEYPQLPPGVAEDTDRHPRPTRPPGIVVSTFPAITREPTSQPETEAPPSPVEPSSPAEENPHLPTLPEVNSVRPTPEIGIPEPEGTPSQPLPEVNVSSEPSQTEGAETTKAVEEPSILTTSPPETDSKHPPHIHAIDVECAKDMMTINIEFDKPFDGIIYSKGFYSNQDCRYVNQNSGENQYSFTVKLDSCGTQFVNAFDTENQSYLENVLVLQNEPEIQEVWDTIRSVRCLWEGSLSKSLTISLSIGMLSQEIVTFSGDTAVARLDIQRGEGPFAPSADGLVPIGEKMTLVISISGDPGFDIHVKDCKATDTDGNLKYPLTDEDGCVLRPKLFGAFQKTRNTGNTDASIIAYAFFNAFKFPDLMDLMIECNVELCKTDCEVCPNPDQKVQPGKRRRRDIYNETLGEPVKVGKLLKVLVPQDLSNGEALIEFRDGKEFCVSVTSFVLASVFLISLLACSILFSGYMFLKHRTTPYKHQL